MNIFIFARAKGASVHKGKVSEVEKVVNELCSCCIDSEWWQPYVAQRWVTPLCERDDVGNGFFRCDPHQVIFFNNVCG